MKERKEIKNIAASVKEKLMNYSKSNSLLFNSVLLQFLQERFFIGKDFCLPSDYWLDEFQIPIFNRGENENIN